MEQKPIKIDLISKISIPHISIEKHLPGITIDTHLVSIEENKSYIIYGISEYNPLYSLLIIAREDKVLYTGDCEWFTQLNYYIKVIMKIKGIRENPVEDEEYKTTIGIDLDGGVEVERRKTISSREERRTMDTLVEGKINYPKICTITIHGGYGVGWFFHPEY